MRVLLLAFLLMLTSPALMAGDSGIYFSQDGEGIVLSRSGDTVVTYFFTYGFEGAFCEPSVSPSLFECDINAQRWFYAADDMVGNVVQGILYLTKGVAYPDGIDGVVGQSEPVGLYTLVREGDGFLMVAMPFGPELDTEDHLFNTIFDFTTRLFSAVD